VFVDKAINIFYFISQARHLCVSNVLLDPKIEGMSETGGKLEKENA
jgi:hypothetical protein